MNGFPVVEVRHLAIDTLDAHRPVPASSLEEERREVFAAIMEEILKGGPGPGQMRACQLLIDHLARMPRRLPT